MRTLPTAIPSRKWSTLGSYGYQLNRILDALAVLIREQEDPQSPRTDKDHRMLCRLLDLADAADEAAKQAKQA